MPVVGGVFAALIVVYLIVMIPIWRLPAVPEVVYPNGFGVKVLVIDPGHGGENEGARTWWGEREKARNLRYARALKRRLEATGRWVVHLTRDEDRDLPNSERPLIANAFHADLYLCLHANANAPDLTQRGFAVIWYLAQEDAERSHRFADVMAASLAAAGLTPDRTMGRPFMVRHANPDTAPAYALTHDTLPVYVRERIDHRMVYPATMPAILIETHYLTDLGEATRFTTKAMTDHVVRALEAGLVGFLTTNRDVDGVPHS
ncbi:N-acetylmuramoyl-L-alanine amidase [bacterium]|nr:N-acetylmuramoyl-L-alanine amidase [bacterium]